MVVQVSINGETSEVPEGQTILGLLRDLQFDPERVAVEMDLRIVKRPLWETTVLAAGSRLEIVQFVGGG